MKKTRVDEVLNRLERMGLDQIIITDANSIFYLWTQGSAWWPYT